MDLSYRMMVDGMSNYYIPTPIIHYKGECTKTNSINYIKMFYEAMLIFTASITIVTGGCAKPSYIQLSDCAHA